MIYIYDLSVIVTTTSQVNLDRVIHYLESQEYEGINVEFVFVIESELHLMIKSKLKMHDIKIIRQNPHLDNGSTARDIGTLSASGEYVVYWDDDNIYYSHALVSSYCTASGYDIGLVNVIHQGQIIPNGLQIKAGYIDTMCLCVKKEKAILCKWADDYGRYADYRYLNKLLNITRLVNYNKIIIGQHL